MRLPVGYTLYRRRRVDSTNAVALGLAAGGAAHGTVVVAETQSAGRGRRGRSWISIPGNLFLTVVARSPPDRPLAQLSFVAALALGDALSEVADVAYKWPNDVLVRGRKVAGILVEADRGAAAVGVGVNLVAAPEVGAPAAGDLGGRIGRTAAAERFCRGFEEWHRCWAATGFTPLRRAWLDRAAGLGVVAAAGRVGRFAGLDSEGGLLLAQGADGARAVAAGDVVLMDAPRDAPMDASCC